MKLLFEIHCHTRYPVFGGYLLLPGLLARRLYRTMRNDLERNIIEAMHERL